MADIKEELREYIVENFLFGDSDFEFDEDTSFMDSGILDSTGILELITFVESTFNITINDDEVLPDNLDSLKNLEAFIRKKG